MMREVECRSFDGVRDLTFLSSIKSPPETPREHHKQMLPKGLKGSSELDPHYTEKRIFFNVQCVFFFLQHFERSLNTDK